MGHSFLAEVKACVAFNDAEWEILKFEFSGHHYDTSIKMAGAQGGWFYGLNNQRSWVTENREQYKLTLTFRQLDYMIKSVEMDDSFDGRDIDKKLRTIIKELSAMTYKINLPLQDNG